jgi:hypothetical protein
VYSTCILSLENPLRLSYRARSGRRLDPPPGTHISDMRLTLASFAMGTLASGLLTGTASPQVRPDFSGRWSLDSAAVAQRATASDSAARAQRAGGAYGARPDAEMGSGWGRTITITQNQSRLTVEYEFLTLYDLQPPFRFAYALDGSETADTVNLGLGPQAQRSRTAWQGDTLVITTVQTFSHPDDGRHVPYEVKRRLTLLSPGSLLVESVIDGVLGGPSTTTRTVYRKS